MKTVQEYMNDPRFLNDPGMAGALEPIKEIHAIRLKIQDEMAGMSLEEKIDSLNKEAVAMGFSLCYDLEGRGKLKPRQSVTQ
jgi:hypothetical protein